MADGRMLKRVITRSKKLAELKTDKARLLWFYLLPFTDIEGRIEADPDDIREEFLRRQRKGYSIPIIQACLEDLHDVGLIVLYAVGNKQYLEYTRFWDEQNLRRDKEAETRIPGPTTGQVRDQGGSAHVKLSKVKLSKEKYMEFVFLTKDEYQKLIEKFGEKQTKEKIEELNNGIGSKDYKYTSHYHTILSWDRKHKKDNKQAAPDKTCIVCKKPGRKYQADKEEKQIWLCEVCLMCINAADITAWGKLPPAVIERKVEEGKAKLKH